MGKYWKRLGKKARKREARSERRAEERKNRNQNKPSSAGSAAFRDNDGSHSSYPAKNAKTQRRAERATARAAQAQAAAAASGKPFLCPAPSKAAKGGLSRRFNAWADGSALGDGSIMGAGWYIEEVTAANENIEIGRYSKPVLEPRFNGTSTFAELAAATEALNSLPAGSRVRLHLDCMTVVETLREGTIENNLGASKRHKDMRLAGEKLFNAVARHQSVEVVKVTDSVDKKQRIAHRLSREGSSEADLIRRGGFGNKPL